jgi:hypothetical protein
MDDIIGKTVIVESISEITYTGKLVEMNDEEIHLESSLGWIVVPTAQIRAIREKID